MKIYKPVTLGKDSDFFYVGVYVDDKFVGLHSIHQTPTSVRVAARSQPEDSSGFLRRNSMHVIKVVVEEEAGVTHDVVEEQLCQALADAQSNGDIQFVVVSADVEMQ